MKIITVPEGAHLYPDLAEQTVLKARFKSGNSRLSVSYSRLGANIQPVLAVDFFNDKGKQYSVRYNLPPDTPERTGRRMSLLMRLIEKEAGDPTRQLAA